MTALGTISNPTRQRWSASPPIFTAQDPHNPLAPSASCRSASIAGSHYRVARVGQGHELVVVVGIDLRKFKVRPDDRPAALWTAPGPRLQSFGFGARQRSGLERLALRSPLAAIRCRRCRELAFCSPKPARIA